MSSENEPNISISVTYCMLAQRLFSLDANFYATAYAYGYVANETRL